MAVEHDPARVQVAVWANDADAAEEAAGGIDPIRRGNVVAYQYGNATIRKRVEDALGDL